MIQTSGYGDEDFEQVYAFLARLYEADRSHPYWLPSRWEYAACFVSPLYLDRGYPDWKPSIRIWKTDGDEIVGLVNSENPDENAFLHVDPAYRHLEKEMLSWAEDHIAVDRGETRRHELVVWTLEGDTQREVLLRTRGYRQRDAIEYLRWQPLDRELPEVRLPAGYAPSSIAEGAKVADKIECAARAFNSEKMSLDVHRALQSAPSYRADLDVSILNPDGKVVSLCTIWFNQQNNIGYFEPVATHPDYQRRGLGKAVLTEGLRRLRALGADTAYVGAFGEHRGAFYHSAGFDQFVVLRPWEKIWR